MISKNYQFQIRKCNQDILDKKYGKGKKKCEKDEVINEYIKDISVDAWNVQESIDFTKYNGVRPTYKMQDKFGSWLLHPGVHTWEYQYFQMHEIEAMDNFIQIDVPTYEGRYYTLGKRMNNPMHIKAEPGFLTISIFLQ